MEFIDMQQRQDKNGKTYHYEKWTSMNDGVEVVMYSGNCKKEDFERLLDKGKEIGFVDYDVDRFTQNISFSIVN